MMAWYWIFRIVLPLLLFPGMHVVAGSNVIVIVNADLPDSVRLGEKYLVLRDVPEHHLVKLRFSHTERLNWDEFDEQVRQPLQAWFEEHGQPTLQCAPVLRKGERSRKQVVIHSPVRYAVSMWGVPYEIMDSKGRVVRKMERLEKRGDQRNYASFDTALSVVLWPGTARVSAVANPLMRGGASPGHILLATRMDGPNVEVVRTRMEETLEVEAAGGLQGVALIDSHGYKTRKDGYGLADQWLQNSARRLEEQGWTVQLDQTPNLVESLEAGELLAYYQGWYSKHVGGVFASQQRHFRSGGIAAHLHSLAGGDVRSADRYWLGPLLMQGACATFGSVNEPYLHGVPRMDQFTALLLDGKTYGEALYGSLPLLCWQTVIVGDPLYRPFPKPENN